MSDSGDTGACWAAEGDGCGHARATTGDCAPSSSDGPSTNLSSAARVEGDGCSCASQQPPAPLALWLGMLALTLFRRVGPALAVGLVALPAWGVDAQHLQTPDAGPFGSVPNPTVGPAWSGRLTLGSSYAHDLVVLRDGSEEQHLLSRVWTNQGTVSAAVDQWFRVGATLPVHSRYRLGDVPEGSLPGDLALWVMVPMSGEAAPLQAAWTMALDLPRPEANARLLGDPGAVRGQLSARRTLGRIVTGGSAALRLQRPTDLPGLTWGNRLEYTAGLALTVRGPLAATAEILGSTPLGTGGGVGAWPVEALATGRWALSDELSLQVGAGRGLDRGLGSPDWRLLGQVALEGVQARDPDHDGMASARDLCPNQPEDFDDWRDRDGCPDPDNDVDGWLDGDDACPNEAETHNGLRDDDGCPDHFSKVLLSVRSTEPGWLERATVELDGDTLVMLPGEVEEREVMPGRHVLRAVADAHLPLREDLAFLGEGPYPVELVLQPLYTGKLRLTLVDPAGRAISGSLEATVPRERIDEGVPPDAGLMLDESVVDVMPVPSDGAELVMPVGPSWLLLSAPGHQDRIVSADLARDEAVALTVALDPLSVWLERSELHVSDALHFTVDSAVVDERSQAVLGLLAAWLIDHPEVELLRVEGHADDIGNPRYNHALSIRRARAVTDRLVDAGVAADRLEAIGSGEALAGPGGAAADRAVTFLVVVWDESVAAPDGDAAAAQ